MIVRTDPADSFTPSQASLGSVIVKLSPFSQAEIDALTRYAADMGFVVPYTPGTRPSVQGAPSTSESEDFAAVLGPHSAEFVAGYLFDISPAVDDRPFFFNRAPIVPWLAAHLGLSPSSGVRPSLGVAAQILLVSLVMTALGAALLLFLPYAAHRGRRDTTPSDSDEGCSGRCTLPASVSASFSSRWFSSKGSASTLVIPSTPLPSCSSRCCSRAPSVASFPGGQRGTVHCQRWMGSRGEVHLSNDGSARRLRITGWIPVELMKERPAIRISVGAHVVDSFVESRRDFEWTYAVGPDVLGTAPSVTLDIETSKTVQPPGDPRDLGIAIERVDWESARP